MSFLFHVSNNCILAISVKQREYFTTCEWCLRGFRWIQVFQILHTVKVGLSFGLWIDFRNCNGQDNFSSYPTWTSWPLRQIRCRSQFTHSVLCHENIIKMFTVEKTVRLPVPMITLGKCSRQIIYYKSTWSLKSSEIFKFCQLYRLNGPLSISYLLKNRSSAELRFAHIMNNFFTSTRSCNKTLKIYTMKTYQPAKKEVK